MCIVWIFAKVTALMGLHLAAMVLVFESVGDGFSTVHAPALGVYGSAAVLRPAGSPFMPLRRTHQAPELRMGLGLRLRNTREVISDS